MRDNPLQVRFNNTMQRLASCAAQSTDPDAAEETAVRLRDPRFFEEQMEMLSALLCISDQGSAIELVRCALATDACNIDSMMASYSNGIAKIRTIGCSYGLQRPEGRGGVDVVQPWI